jgi:hypothetical protein
LSISESSESISIIFSLSINLNLGELLAFAKATFFLGEGSFFSLYSFIKSSSVRLRVLDDLESSDVISNIKYSGCLVSELRYSK